MIYQRRLRALTLRKLPSAALETAKGLSVLRLHLPTLLAEVSKSTQNKDADAVNYSRILTTTILENIQGSVDATGRDDIKQAYAEFVDGLTATRNAVLDLQIEYSDLFACQARQDEKI